MSSYAGYTGTGHNPSNGANTIVRRSLAYARNYDPEDSRNPSSSGTRNSSSRNMMMTAFNGAVPLTPELSPRNPNISLPINVDSPRISNDNYVIPKLYNLENSSARSSATNSSRRMHSSRSKERLSNLHRENSFQNTKRLENQLKILCQSEKKIGNNDHLTSNDATATAKNYNHTDVTRRASYNYSVRIPTQIWRPFCNFRNFYLKRARNLIIST